VHGGFLNLDNKYPCIS